MPKWHVCYLSYELDGRRPRLELLSFRSVGRGFQPIAVHYTIRYLVSLERFDEFDHDCVESYIDILVSIVGCREVRHMMWQRKAQHPKGDAKECTPGP